MKETVKSCSCRACRRGRSHSGFWMKKLERAARHAVKVALKKGAEVIAPAHRGQYTD